MTDAVTTDQLSRSFVVMDPAQAATVLPVNETFWQDLDTRFGDFAGHTLVSLYTFDGDWPTWEMHPAGDEIVCLLTGSARLRLRADGGEREVLLESPGQFVIVPRGSWHTAEVEASATMLFITPGQGTENRPEPPGG